MKIRKPEKVTFSRHFVLGKLYKIHISWEENKQQHPLLAKVYVYVRMYVCTNTTRNKKKQHMFLYLPLWIGYEDMYEYIYMCVWTE